MMRFFFCLDASATDHSFSKQRKIAEYNLEVLVLENVKKMRNAAE